MLTLQTRIILNISLGLLLVLLSSCSMLITNTLVEPTIKNLEKQTDLELVCEGAPAYLLMIDSLIASDPRSSDLLRAGAKAYSGYVSAMTECGNMNQERVDAIAAKSRLYGKSLISNLLPIERLDDINLLDARLKEMRQKNVPDLYWGSLAWLTWIEQAAGTPAAMADVIVVEKIMGRVLELDESFQAGSCHLFFGAYLAAKPPMFGGDFTRSRTHFERAMEISDHKFLLVQTTFAATLARQLFDRALHDSLLQEVLDFPVENAPEYALANQIAKRRARKLLDEDFFAE